MTRSSARLGISPLSWTNQAIMELGDDISFEQFAAEASQAGFTGAELGRKFPRPAADIKSQLAGFGLSAVSSWYSGHLAEVRLEDELPGALDYADFLLEAGCPVMVYGECAAGPKAGAEAKLCENPPLSAINFEDYCQKLTRLAEAVEARGIDLVYHPHMMQPIDTNDKINKLMEGTGPAVNLLLDTGHIAMSGGDYRAVMDDWWERIRHIHLKDVRRKVMDALDPKANTFNEGVYRGMFTVPGDGDLDFAPITQKIAKDGYGGWLLVEAEQDPKTALPGPLAKKSFAYLSGLLAKSSIPFERNPNHVA